MAKPSQEKGKTMSDAQPVELIERSAETNEEAYEAGFFGHVTSFPNELHHTGNEVLRQATFQVTDHVPAPAPAESARGSLEGAVVNSDDAPTPSGGVSGPGASQPSQQDENEEDKDN